MWIKNILNGLLCLIVKLCKSFDDLFREGLGWLLNEPKQYRLYYADICYLHALLVSIYI